MYVKMKIYFIALSFSVSLFFSFSNYKSIQKSDDLVESMYEEKNIVLPYS